MGKPEVDRAQLVAAVERALGQRSIRARLVPTGEENHVCSVELPSGQVFAKIGHPDRVRMEARAYRAAAAVGFPVPEVLAEEALGPWVFVVTRAAEGVQLTRLEEPERARAVRELGEALRALHAISATGFGPADPPRILEQGEWSAADGGAGWIARMAEWGLGYLVGNELISADDAASIRDALAARPVGSEGPSSLLHGDLASPAAYADPATGALTAVIDFGDVTCGPPAWEFVPVAAQDARYLRPMLDGYGADLDECRPILAAGMLGRAAAAARWVHENGFDPDAIWSASVRELAADPSLADRLEPVLPQD